MSLRTLRWALLADGRSDADLQPIIRWTVIEHLSSEVQIEDGFLSGSDLEERLRRAVQEFPAHLFFVHRDAETEEPEKRLQEIREAAEAFGDLPRPVAIVPVRMTEAWLLIDERAIRRAADHPNGRVELDLPKIGRLESLPNPKEVLDRCLLQAADPRGQRRRRQLVKSLPRRRRRVAELINDYTPLRELSAFRRFEADTRAALEDLFQ